MNNDSNPLARHGGISFLEIPVRDAHASSEFYRHLLNWEIDVRAANDVRFADRGGFYIGRFRSDRAPMREAGIMLYIYVDHLATAVERVSRHGGEIVKPPYQEGDLCVAEVRDPAGNILGLWQFGVA